MSETRSIVRVDKHVKIVLVHDFTSIGGGLHVDFDLKLSSRGTDFTVYANTGYTENTRDTDLLAAIIGSLLTVRSGISSIRVRAFAIEIDCNAASDPEDIMQQLQYAAQRVGYAVEYVDKTQH